MANSTTNLDLISVNQSQKEVTANALFDAGSPATLFGRRASTSVALTWGYYGGTVNVGGTPTQIANGTVTLTASATNYVQANASGVVSVNTTGYGSNTPLYKVITGASSVTSYEDNRMPPAGFTLPANVAKTDVNNVFTKSQTVSFSTLTDAATIAVDASLSNNFIVTLAGNRTLANPTNLADGMILNFYIKQDATGSRTLAYGSAYKFSGGLNTLSTTASARDVISCIYNSADGVLLCNLTKAYA